MSKKTSCDALSSEIKDLKTQLDLLNRRYRSVVDHCHEAVFFISPDGRILFANPAACEMFRMAEQDYIHCSWLILFDKNDPGLPPALETVKRHDDYIGELLCRTKDRTIFPGHVSLLGMRDDDGGQGASIIIRNVSGSIEKEAVLKPVEASAPSPETALFKHESRWRDILIHIPQIAVTLNSRSEIVFANHCLLELTGWKESEIIGKNWFDIFIPENIRESLRAMFASRIFTRQIDEYGTFENEIVTRSGEFRNIAWFNALSKDMNGNVSDITSLGIDITNQRKSENALQESERRFKSLFQYHSAVMLVIDLETGEIIDANDAAADYYGWTVEEIKGMCIQQMNVLPPEATLRELKKAAAFGSSKGEYQHRKKDGTLRHIESYRNRIQIAGKYVIYAIIHDITDRKLAEEALQDNEKLFRSTFMNSPVALSLLRMEDRVCIDVNQAEVDMFGYTRDELVGKSRAINLWDDNNDRQRFIGNLLRKGKEKNENVRMRHKDGRLIIASISAGLLDLKGEKHILYASEDITERKQAEELIKQNLLEKETLLKEIHHRVKNNLAVISGLIGMQSSRIDDETTRQMFDVCQNRIRSMALIHEKLYQSDNLSAINFSDYIHTIALSLLSSHQLQGRKINIGVHSRDIHLGVDKAIPCGLILNELITNAMKHAFKESLAPELTIRFEETDHVYSLAVRDNGIGLPENFSASETNSLGFKIVRALTKQLGGNVQFSSNALESHGTTVIVTFRNQ